MELYSIYESTISRNHFEIGSGLSHNLSGSRLPAIGMKVIENTKLFSPYFPFLGSQVHLCFHSKYSYNDVSSFSHCHHVFPQEASAD